MRLALTIPWLGILAGGCTLVGTDYVRPELEIESAYAAAEEAGVVSKPPIDLGRWWEAFDDPALDALVERALEGSLDLRASVAGVRQAAAIRGQAIGNRFPDIDGTGSYSRSRVGANSVPAFADPQTFDLVSLGLEFAWEFDLWGRVTRVIEVASAELDASVEDMRDVRALLVASVVSAYVDLREGQSRVEVATQNIEIQRRSLELTDTRFRAGAAPRLDVAQAQTNLANTESALPQFEDAVRSAALRLGVLLGEDPTGFTRALDEGGAVPAPPDEVESGVPADLLRQRPDVRAAERRLAAEVARVGVEIADLLPRFTLGGTLSYESTSSGSLLDRRSGVFGLGPSFSWNIFDGGRERGEVRAQREVAEIALLDYRQSVLLALEEAEGALFGLARDRERALALQRATDAARDSAQLSRQLYLEGRSNFQNVLDSERALFDAEESAIAARADVARRFVVLLRALGGGWQQDL